jgi:hypothetical protein
VAGRGRAALTRRPTDADVAVIGAGAAGLATAIFTRRLAPAASVLLLDGARRPGAKILVSGGARCNVTNTVVTERDFFGGRPAIVRRILRAWPVADTVAFFERIGVLLREEEDGKLFPQTNRSRDVLDALMRELDGSGATLRAASRVLAVAPGEDGFSIQTPGGTLTAGSVVLATGGQSLPKTGSDGGGYAIASALGHTIVPTTPALVPLVLADRPDAMHRALSGVAHDVELSLWMDNAVALRIAGALLWTHFGVSGPAVLNMSRHWLRARLEGRATRVTLGFVPGDRFEHADARWTALAIERPRASIAAALASFLPSSVAAALLRRLRLDGSLALAHFARSNRRRLAHALTEFPLDVIDSRGYNYAEATAGGVPLDEIDPATMESRKTRRLFLVGEILDVDGRIGGFNFQWAWSTAHVAAAALAQRSA